MKVVLVQERGGAARDELSFPRDHDGSYDSCCEVASCEACWWLLKGRGSVGECVK
jgi:hypothetical protein